MSKTIAKLENDNLPTTLIGKIPEYIDDITEVIRGCKYPMTISINGEWGSGKTTFIEQWYKREDIASIYIDAFATDYMDSPLETILWKLASFFDDKKILNAELPEKRGEYYTKLIFKSLGQSIARLDLVDDIKLTDYPPPEALVFKCFYSGFSKIAVDITLT